MLQKKYLFVLILINFVNHTSNIFAQQITAMSGFTYDNCIRDVSFYNGIEVLNDLTDIPYSTPQYQKNCNTGNDLSKPVAYKSNSTPEIRASLKINCNGASKWVSAKVHFGDNIVKHYYPAKLITPFSSSNFIYPSNVQAENQKATNSNGSLYVFEPNKVNYIDKYTIVWRIAEGNLPEPSLEDDSKWLEVGASVNQFYITYKAPILSQAAYHLEPTQAFHTLLHLGCVNGINQTNPDNIVDNIYNYGIKIQGNENKVFRADGDGPIRYWGPNIAPPACYEVSKILKIKDAVCGGWASLFEDVIRLQGINIDRTLITWGWCLSSQDIYKQDKDIMDFFGLEYHSVTPLPYDGNINPGCFGKPMSQFLVKNWQNFNTKFTMNDFTNKYFEIPTDPLIIGNGNIIPNTELLGVKAQGNANPKSEFETHDISRFNGKYYDASYGSPIALSKNEWENNALHSFGGIIVYEKWTYPNITQDYYINWIGDQNNTNLQAIYAE